MHIKWETIAFENLTPTALYSIMQLRNSVFVVEQNCVYQDADDKDQKSWHFCGWDGPVLAAYCRLLPPGVAFGHASIGRVITHPQYRSFGLGRQMMQQAMPDIMRRSQSAAIQIGAQQYLQKFYESLGFVAISEPYLEDGIPHLLMLFCNP
jgi:ElaA protein